MVFVHRGAGSTIGCLVVARLYFRSPLPQGFQLCTPQVPARLGISSPQSHPAQPRLPPGVVAQVLAGVELLGTCHAPAVGGAAGNRDPLITSFLYYDC